MDKAAAEEKRLKAASGEGSRKRPSSSDEQASESKRPKLEQDSVTSTSSASFLAAFDFTSLPSALITELIVANLEAFTEPALIGLVQAYRQSRGVDISATPPPSAPLAPSAPPPGPEPTHIAQSAAPPAVKDEPVDPLQMDIDEDEIEYEPDRLNLEVCYHPVSSFMRILMNYNISCQGRYHL